VNALRRDLAILRGASAWRRKLVLFSYIVVVLTLLADLDGVFVEHVAATEIVTLDVVMFGAAIASGIVARGFHAVPKFETEVLPPSPAEDRIARERAAWARKFKVSA